MSICIISDHITIKVYNYLQPIVPSKSPNVKNEGGGLQPLKLPLDLPLKCYNQEVATMVLMTV